MSSVTLSPGISRLSLEPVINSQQHNASILPPATVPRQSSKGSNTECSTNPDLIPFYEARLGNFTSQDVAKYLWLNPKATIKEEIVKNVNAVATYLYDLGYELRGAASDGDCYCHAFLNSLSTLSREIPSLKEKSDKVQYLRDLIATEYSKNPKVQKRAEEIQLKTKALSANEGDLLAHVLNIPIRTVTFQGGINDMLTFPKKNKPSKEWDTIAESKRPAEFILIVDLVGHFISAQPMSPARAGNLSGSSSNSPSPMTSPHQVRHIPSSYCNEGRTPLSRIKTIEEGVKRVEDLLAHTVLCRHDIENINQAYQDIDLLVAQMTVFPACNGSTVIEKIIAKVERIAECIKTSSADLISLYYLQGFSEKDLFINGYFEILLSRFDRNPDNITELANLLPYCVSVDQFNEDSRVLIGSNSNAAVGRILKGKKAKLQKKADLSGLRMDNSLAALINAQRGEMSEGFGQLDYNGFVSEVQTRVLSYRNATANFYFLQLNKIRSRVLRSFNAKAFLKLSDDVLNDAREQPLRGFNESDTSAQRQAIYCTGNIHHSLYGATHFPAELNLLDLVCYTLSHYVQQKDIDPAGVVALARKSLSRVREQLDLFGQIQDCLTDLQEDHKTLMEGLQKNVNAAKQTHKAYISQSVQSWMAENEQRVLEEVVGRKMFGWNILAHSPLNLPPYAHEIWETIKTRELLSPVRVLVTALIDPQENEWREIAMGADQKIVKLSSLENLLQLDGLNKKPGPTRTYSNPQIVRRIWWNNERFQSDLSVTAPLHWVRYPLQTGLVNVHSDPVQPSKPIVDCSVTYNKIENSFTTKFESTSRLQEMDIREIPKVTDEAGTKRQKIIENALDYIKVISSGYIVSDEICLPLDDEKMVPIVLPANFMKQLRYSLCPEFDKMRLCGKNIELKYSFKKKDQSYQLDVHAVYEGEPYCSKCVFECDAVTVESYADQMNDTPPNIIEFLLCAMRYNNDGLPCGASYVNARRIIIEPELMRFPQIIAPKLMHFRGLESIFNKFPNDCFTFDHTQYNDIYDQLAVDMPESTILQKTARKFYKKTEVKFEKNYMAVKAKIQQQVQFLEQNYAYVDFKKSYDLFMAMAKLVSNFDEARIESLLENNARIIPPVKAAYAPLSEWVVSEWVEQAPLYEAPASESLETILTQLRRYPSVAIMNLEKYKRQLKGIIECFNQESVNAEFLQELAEENGTFDPEYDLAKANSQNAKAGSNDEIFDDEYFEMALSRDKSELYRSLLEGMIKRHRENPL